MAIILHFSGISLDNDFLYSRDKTFHLITLTCVTSFPLLFFAPGRCSTDRNLRGPQERSSWAGGKRESWICFCKCIHVLFYVIELIFNCIASPKRMLVSLSEPVSQTEVEFTNRHLVVCCQQTVLFILLLLLIDTTLSSYPPTTTEVASWARKTWNIRYRRKTNGFGL